MVLDSFSIAQRAILYVLFILRYDLGDRPFCGVLRAARSPCSCGYALPVDPSASTVVLTSTVFS